MNGTKVFSRKKAISSSLVIALLAALLSVAAAPPAFGQTIEYCNGLEATIVGTAGDDILSGTSQDDVIVGLGGNDTINGLSGSDTICGGEGDDTINGQAHDDTIFGDGGNDTIKGLSGNDTIEGGDGNDTIEGNTQNDTVLGGNGDDDLNGGPGDDTLIGGRGTDSADGFTQTDACSAETEVRCEIKAIFEVSVEGPGGVTVDVTSSAPLLDGDVIVSYEVDEAYRVTDSLASPAYEFLLRDGVEPFDSADVTIPYRAELLNGAPATNLRIYTFNEDYGLWVPVEGEQVVDEVNETVSVTISHFSKYAVFNLGVDGFAKYWQTKPVFCVQPGFNPNAGLDIAFLIDTSGSMGGNDPAGLRIDAAQDIVDRSTDQDRVAVISFSNSAVRRAPLTFLAGPTNRQTIFDALEAARFASGGTNITSAVRLGTSTLVDGATAGRPRIAILLTDGVSGYDASATTDAAASDVVIYTVGLGNGVDSTLLTQIAEGTGGRYLQATTAAGIGDIYDEIADTLVDDGSDGDGDGLTDCEETRGMYTTDGFYITLPLDTTTTFFPLPRVMTSDPDLVNTDGDDDDDNVEMGAPRDLRDNAQIAETYKFLIDAGITRVYNPNSDPRVDDRTTEELVITDVDVSWGLVGVGGATLTQVAGKPTLPPAARPIGAGPLIIAGLVGELVVQYFQTFDLDQPFVETQVAHIFPMVLDRPGDDLDLNVSRYPFIPWVQPETKPYESDPLECLAWVNAIAGAMLVMIQRRVDNPQIASDATVAVALYCIDGKIGGAAARSGGVDKIPSDMPGLTVNPDLTAQREAFFVENPLGGTQATPQDHAETNLLGGLIEGVPITPVSIGEIFMLVDNPRDGRICERCLQRMEAFQRTFPLVRLTAIARNNAFQEGVSIETSSAAYDRILRFE